MGSSSPLRLALWASSQYLRGGRHYKQYTEQPSATARPTALPRTPLRGSSPPRLAADWLGGQANRFAQSYPQATSLWTFLRSKGYATLGAHPVTGCARAAASAPVLDPTYTSFLTSPAARLNCGYTTCRKRYCHQLMAMTPKLKMAVSNTLEIPDSPISPTISGRERTNMAAKSAPIAVRIEQIVTARKYQNFSITFFSLLSLRPPAPIPFHAHGMKCTHGLDPVRLGLAPDH